MRAYRDDIRARAITHGRNADDVKVLFQVTPILGASHDEAVAIKKWQDEQAAADIERQLAGITLSTGVDLSKYDLDMPMSDIADEIQTSYGQGSVANLFDHVGSQTLREFVSKPSEWRSFRPCGTAEEVAEDMGALAEEVGGDGFLVSNFYGISRRYIDEVTEGLVPALQRRKLVRSDYSSGLFRDNLLAF
jgi:alkanesulfonate monooxygenase SsuD/methylene tetrahydromethanopterin reductase-like flavin-dependent oxidoreductase (luciferase family)